MISLLLKFELYNLLIGCSSLFHLSSFLLVFHTDVKTNDDRIDECAVKTDFLTFLTVYPIFKNHTASNCARNVFFSFDLSSASTIFYSPDEDVLTLTICDMLEHFTGYPCLLEKYGKIVLEVLEK
jgi:hypothetical protein